MIQGIEKSRNNCALQGAISTVMEIEGVVPIIHSTAGCTIQQTIGNKVSRCSGLSVSATNIIEKQVIFGGGSRLREQIKNTVKVIEGELYVIISGCTPELVGDDVITMTKEAREQGEAAVYFKAPGFKGRGHVGYEGVVNAIISQLPLVKTMDTEKQADLINLFGIIPNQDIHWRGDLVEIKRVLEGIGLRVNTLFGHRQGIESWTKISAAALNIVFSPWGSSIAVNLEKEYKTPFLTLKSIPVGAKNTSDFLVNVAELVGISSAVVERFVLAEKLREEYYIENLWKLYVDYDFQKTFGIIGDAGTVYGIHDFLSETFGLIPVVKVFTDPLRDENEILEENEYRTEDLNEIQKIIKSYSVELLLGSSLEKTLADELSIPLQVISFPESNSVILNKSYAGFRGALQLLEDLSTILLNSTRAQQLQLRADIKSLVRSSEK